MKLRGSLMEASPHGTLDSPVGEKFRSHSHKIYSLRADVLFRLFSRHSAGGPATGNTIVAGLGDALSWREGSHCDSEKFTSTCVSTSTGAPFNNVGRYSHWRTASSAAGESMGSPWPVTPGTESTM